jgi:hypothetical protein
MLAAEIYGKISGTNPAHERMEDTLTSYVLSLFRYLNKLEILELFLGKAKNINGNSLAVSKIKSADVFFWPLFNFGGTRYREPDAFIGLEEENGRKHAAVIEAKYDAGLSNVSQHEKPSEEDEVKKISKEETESLILGHQLADEYCGLKCGKWFFREIHSRRDPQIYRTEAERKWLLYITSHYEFPKRDIEEAIEATGNMKRCKRASENCAANAGKEIYWVGWRDLYAVIEEMELLQIPSEALMDYTAGERYLIIDLAEVLRVRGLQTFNPFRELEPVQLFNSIFDDYFLFRNIKPVGLYETILEI